MQAVHNCWEPCKEVCKWLIAGTLMAQHICGRRRLVSKLKYSMLQAVLAQNDPSEWYAGSMQLRLLQSHARHCH